MIRIFYKFSFRISAVLLLLAVIVSGYAQSAAVDDVRNRAIRVGVMLPLHDDNGDGRRMVEYYRGVLMACDSLKKLGVSTDVFAWNLSEDGDVSKLLDDPNAAKLDLLIGPLYSKQVHAMSKFVEKHDIRMVQETGRRLRQEAG